MSRPGALVRALADDGRMRVLAVVADGCADETRTRHKLGGRASQLAAEGVVASLLLSAHIKGDERLMVQIQAEAPRFAFACEVRSDGATRARLTPARVGDQALKGALLAIKSTATKELYRGIGEITESLERSVQVFFDKSLQTRGVVRLGARVADDGQIVMATGLLVEALPDQYAAGEFEALAEPLRTMDLSELMTSFAFGNLLGSPVAVLEQRVVRFESPVDVERIEAMLRALGAEELRSMADELGEARVTEHFSNEEFVVNGARLLELADELEA